METSDVRYINTAHSSLLSSGGTDTAITDKDYNKFGKVKASLGKIKRCKVCRKTFRNQSTFLAHIKLHRNKVKNQKEFQHIQQQHGHQEDFYCKFCETNLRGLVSFLNHMKGHGSHNESNKYLTQISNVNNQANEVIIGSSESLPESLHHLTATIENDQERHQVDVNGHTMNLDENVVTQASTLVAEAMSELPSLSSSYSMTSNGNNTNQQSNTYTNANDGLHIEIPNHVKSIYLSNNNNSNNIQNTTNAITKHLESLHNKIDIIIKHLNIPLDEEGNPLPPPTNTIEVQQPTENEQDKNSMDENDPDDDGETVLLEGFPPSYSLVQAAKEQQQQEFYALTLSSRQAQQVFKTDSNSAIATSPNEMKLLKGKGIDLWVPASSHHYISQIATLTDTPQAPEEETTELTIPIPTTNTPIATLPSNIVDKIFVESRSRANFAKNLTFAIFSQEERRGKNCTGRVFGKAQHKGQLEPVKLNAVKEATFRKYPCNPNLVDITWRKECITAIDSGLRNENRSSTMKVNSVTSSPSSSSMHHQHHHHHQLVVDATDVVDVDVDSKVSKIEEIMSN